MSVPTYEDLLRVIKEFEGLQDEFKFCRRCIKVSQVLECSICKIVSCYNCATNQKQLSPKLLSYLALLNIQLDVLEFINKLLRINVIECQSCYETKCDKCSDFKMEREDNPYQICGECQVRHKYIKCSRCLFFFTPSDIENHLCRPFFRRS